MTNVNNTFKSTKVKYEQSTRTSYVPHNSKSKDFEFLGSYLSGEALSRSQDFTKNTLDIKSSTGLGATTSILNITKHDVLAVFPLTGVIQAKEKKYHTFKSTRQFYIYHRSKDKWNDVIEYFNSYEGKETNVIICTTAEQIIKIRKTEPQLYSRLTRTPTFIDEIHLFASNEWRINLATFINLLTNEWKANYKFSTATPTRHFERVFGSGLDVGKLKRKNERTKNLLFTDSVKNAWEYVFQEMQEGKQIIIFSNDINHHKKEFIENNSINLTGEGLKIKLSAFGKGLDHFKENEIDTEFLNQFGLIFISSKYLTGYDIEPNKETSILILTSNKDESTSYTIEDIIQAYGRVRSNLSNALLCINSIKPLPTLAELNFLEKDAELNYEKSKILEEIIPRNTPYNSKTYKNYYLDSFGYASKLLAFDLWLKKESESIIYNPNKSSLKAILKDYNFVLNELSLTINKELKTIINKTQREKNAKLKSITLNRKILNITKAQENKDLHRTILEMAENPRTKKNKSGFSQNDILLYCITFLMDKVIPHQFFEVVPINSQKRLKSLCREIDIYINTNYPQRTQRTEVIKNEKYKYNALVKDSNIYNEVLPAAEEIDDIIRVFKYCNHSINLSFKSLGFESQKTTDIFYYTDYYKANILNKAMVKHEVFKRLKNYELSNSDIIRIEKRISSKTNYFQKDKNKYRLNVVNQIKECCMYLMSGNEEIFVSSYKDGREYNPLTNLSTIFRENLPYKYKSIDVVSANAQFTDKIINTSIGLEAYNNIMKNANVDRSKAKVLYNSALNNYKLTTSQAEGIYKLAGYNEIKARELARLTSGSEKGSYFKLMAKAEESIINQYKKKNIVEKYCFRLHDSLIVESERDVFPLEVNGVKFSYEIF